MAEQKFPTPLNKPVEVVMKKTVSYEEYLKMIDSAKKKGWKIQAYEIDFYNDELKKPIP